MPSSQPYQIPKILERVLQLNPQSILDVGCGAGKYGMLCREYLEFWDGRNEYTFRRRIDAIEAFSEYITPLHSFVYNNIYVDDVLCISARLKGYDLVLLIDVLEQLPKEEGRDLLTLLILNNENLLISTPKEWVTQSDIFGNGYERHKTIWTEKEFEDIGGWFNFIPDERSIICHIQRLRYASSDSSA